MTAKPADLQGSDPVSSAVAAASGAVHDRLRAVPHVKKRREGSVNVQPSTGFSGVLDPRPASSIPVIPAADRFLSAVRIALASPAGHQVRARHAGLAVALVMAGAEVELRTADGNGRSITTSHATLARRLRVAGHRCTTPTAAKVRYVLRDLGFQTTIDEGRRLSTHERLKMQLETGLTRRRKTATRVLTFPREYAGNEHFWNPLARRAVRALKQLSDTHQKNAQARSRSRKSASTNPNPSPIDPTTATTPPQRAQERPRWSVGMLRLASDVENALSPRSAFDPAPPGTPHIGHYCRLLTLHGITPDDFTGQGVKDLTDSVLKRRGPFGWKAPAIIGKPLAYLGWVLKNAEKEGLIADHVRRAEQGRATAQEGRERALRAAQRPMTAAVENQNHINVSWASRIKADLVKRNRTAK